MTATVGYIGVLVAVVFFGSNFVPLKKIQIGDGVFFQFFMCLAIFMTSIPVIIMQDYPTFYGSVMLGGFLWCTGNMLCPIAIRFIGMGLGQMIWGCVGMIMGWASGTFGLFGLKKGDVAIPAYNFAGVGLAVVGLIIYLNIKSTDTSVDALQQAKAYNPLLNHTGDDDDDIVESNLSTGSFSKSKTTGTKAPEVAADALSSLSETTKRILGLVLAIVAGAFFGCSLLPQQYVNDHEHDGKDNPLNYVFAHFTGILITSWFYTLLYCIFKHARGEKPFLNVEGIIPATICGVMWGIAQIFWFVANGQLGFSITYPIISSGPGFIAALWGIFLFKEITGTRNYLVLLAATAVTLPAFILVGLSR